MAPATVVNDDLDDYGFDDFGGDPFAESGEDNANRADSQSKKRKDASGLGIDEAVAVSKKVRIPRVKLDENRLLSDKGIPKLRKRAGDLKFKGKGHEFSDTARLLSFYQLWLDDLFPKARFLDAAAMVEKAGHKGRMRLARMEWIDEGKPKPSVNPDDDDAELIGEPEGHEPAKFPARVAPIFQNGNRTGERPKTPGRDDLFGDDEIYNATPRASRKEATAKTISPADAPGNSEPDEEDLDALMAEDEAQRTSSTSIFGNGQPNRQPSSLSRQPQDEDDLDALMAEVEASSKATKTSAAIASRPKQSLGDPDEDDLDALMAEAEAEGAVLSIKAKAINAPPQPAKAINDGGDADEEEAMAEMDGLW